MATSQPSPKNVSDEIERPPQAIYYPAITYDYCLKMDPDPEMGIGLVANRKIKKGELVFGDSIEFIFSDVRESDYLLFQGHHKASKKSGTKIPPTMPVTRDMMLRTHGVPALIDGNICWRLEMPGMLINHSCDPNIIDDSHDACRGEAYAARDIKKGEPLTYNYITQYYDRGPFFDKCRCGSLNCLGSMNGFKALSEADQTKYLSKVCMTRGLPHPQRSSMKADIICVLYLHLIAHIIIRFSFLCTADQHSRPGHVQGRHWRRDKTEGCAGIHAPGFGVQSY